MAEIGEGKDMLLASKQVDPGLFGDRRVMDIYSGWTHLVAVLGECLR